MKTHQNIRFFDLEAESRAREEAARREGESIAVIDTVNALRESVEDLNQLIIGLGIRIGSRPCP
jgi:hypothetical protein